MINIGDYNKLTIIKTVDFGVYLDGGNSVEILLPSRYVPETAEVGSTIEVFIYTDSEDRLIATTEHPFIRVGQFAFLQVAETNRVGAFLDWGLPKDLLCPFREQRTRMLRGGEYLVYAYLDHSTKRIVASSKIEKFLGNTIPSYQRGDTVQALVYQHTDIGYKVIVDNLFSGMIYANEIKHPLVIGQKVEACVKNIRDDNKIDLTIRGVAADRVHDIAGKILKHLRSGQGRCDITDASTPEQIRQSFGCSKKDFKKAVGHLLKKQLIQLSPDHIQLVSM